MKVRARHVGYVDDELRRVGDVFTITPDQFSPRWMVRVPDTMPDRGRSAERPDGELDVLGETSHAPVASLPAAEHVDNPLDLSAAALAEPRAHWVPLADWSRDADQDTSSAKTDFDPFVVSGFDPFIE